MDMRVLETLSQPVTQTSTATLTLPIKNFVNLLSHSRSFPEQHWHTAFQFLVVKELSKFPISLLYVCRTVEHQEILHAYDCVFLLLQLPELVEGHREMGTFSVTGQSTKWGEPRNSD